VTYRVGCIQFACEVGGVYVCSTWSGLYLAERKRDWSNLSLEFIQGLACRCRQQICIGASADRSNVKHALENPHAPMQIC